MRGLQKACAVAALTATVTVLFLLGIDVMAVTSGGA